jgi:hypothetical protein
MVKPKANIGENMACPQCRGEVIVEGKIYNQIDYFNPPAYFRPVSASFRAILFSNIKFQNIFFACSLCGLIWSKLDDKALK